MVLVSRVAEGQPGLSGRPFRPDLQVGPRPERSGRNPKCMHLIRLLAMANKLYMVILKSHDD